MPPVNNKITAYLIHEFKIMRNIPLIKILKIINQIIKNVGFTVNKQVINPAHRKNINKDIKISKNISIFSM